MSAPEIRVTGTLASDAEARLAPGDTWWLFLKIQTDPRTPPVAAAKNIGTGVAAAFASKSMAHQLRRGTPVTVRAARYDIAFAPSPPHLVLQSVQHIDYEVTAHPT